MTVVAAILFAVLLVLLGAFQIALVAGAPIGRFAWGGGADRVTGPARIGSIASVALYVVFAVVALLRAGVVGDVAGALAVVILMWVVFGFLVVSVVLNALSKSGPERYVMTPASLLLAILALVVALG